MNPETVFARFQRLVIENEEYLVRRELVAAFKENRPERNVVLPPRAWYDQRIRIVELERADVEHIYL